jgi:hypothetical protein
MSVVSYRVVSYRIVSVVEKSPESADLTEVSAQLLAVVLSWDDESRGLVFWFRRNSHLPPFIHPACRKWHCTVAREAKLFDCVGTGAVLEIGSLEGRRHPEYRCRCHSRS